MTLDVQSDVRAQKLFRDSNLSLHLLIEGTALNTQYLSLAISCQFVVYIFSSSSNCIYNLTINTYEDQYFPQNCCRKPLLSNFLQVVIEIKLEIFCRYSISIFQMSALAFGFSAYTPTYENIANRMSRLKHSRSASNEAQIRRNSVNKNEINPFYIQTRPTSPYQSRKRVSPSGINLVEKQFNSTGDHYAGRLARNVGIRKYNQRQLREIEQGKASVHLKTEENIYSFGNIAQVRHFDVLRNGKQKLIPGRIYKKESLATLMV